VLQSELLIKAVNILNQAKIKYMLTGSVASSLQGEPRATHDIDILINIDHTYITPLLNAFTPPEFYISEEAIHDAINFNSMFNVIDTTSANKIDFWLITAEPFDRSRFKRKQEEHIAGLTMNVSTPEDTILMKLKWAKLSGGSEKQFTDALRVYELQFNILDLNYLESWATKLEIVETWDRLKHEAQPLI